LLGLCVRFSIWLCWIRKKTWDLFLVFSIFDSVGSGKKQNMGFVLSI